MPLSNEIRSGFPPAISFPPELESLCDWVEQNGYPISGYFELSPDNDHVIGLWMGFDNVDDRFGVFGAGPDGSIYAIWKDDAGEQKVVHLGSEGGDLYLLAHSFVDFLRLLAIGYDELGFADMTRPPQDNEGFDAACVNPAFQKWVEETFHVTIPPVGAALFDRDDKTFAAWIDKVFAQYR